MAGIQFSTIAGGGRGESTRPCCSPNAQLCLAAPSSPPHRATGPGRWSSLKWLGTCSCYSCSALFSLNVSSQQEAHFLWTLTQLCSQGTDFQTNKKPAQGLAPKMTSKKTRQLWKGKEGRSWFSIFNILQNSQGSLTVERLSFCLEGNLLQSGIPDSLGWD